MRSVNATAASFGASHLILQAGAELPFGARVELELPQVRWTTSPPVGGIVRWISGEGVGVQLDRPGPKAVWAMRHLRGKRAPVVVRVPT